MVAAVGIKMETAALLRAWVAIEQRITHVVREGNCIAGEEIWGMETSSKRIRVWSREDDSSSVEVSLDAQSSHLSCRYSLRGEHWRFQLIGEGAGLRRATETYTVDEAVNLILDHLVVV